MRILFVIIVLVVGIASRTAAQELRPTHPLDALTSGEIKSIVDILQQQGLSDKKTAFPVMELYEPEKPAVVAWTPGRPFARAAHVAMRRNGKTFEAIVDISQQKVLSHREVPGAQPSIMQAEWDAARQLTKSDPRWQAAMQARGISDLQSIVCTPLPAGYRDRSDTSARRLIRVPCFAQVNKLHPVHARPIEGVVALIDPDAQVVVDVMDTGQNIPLLPSPANYRAITPDKAMKPVVISLPRGTNIKITGKYQIGWQNWSFHLRADRRAGVIVSLVRFNDAGRRRLIAYQMSVAEMFVPYMDPDETWAFRGYLDAGELGLGYLISSLNPGQDCPRQSFYINLLMPSDKGGLFRAPRSLCIFERATGDPAWRHYDAGSQRAAARPEIELVVRHIPTIGNYDYVIDYVFQNRGNIKLRVGATGLDATRAVITKDLEAPSARQDTRFGALIAPYTVAPYHDHYISYRLDLDIDGTRNMFMRDRIEPRGLAPGHQRGGVWILQGETVEREGPIVSGNGSYGEVWRIANLGVSTGLKYDPSYQIEPGHLVRSILPADDPLQKRAGFAAHSLWLTAYNRQEKWSAGDYPNLSAPGQGLPSYVADGQNIANSDIVAWYTLGFRHITRPEDFPILPTRWHEFQLRPVHFFDRDPSASLVIEPLKQSSN